MNEFPPTPPMYRCLSGLLAGIVLMVCAASAAEPPVPPDLTKGETTGVDRK